MFKIIDQTKACNDQAELTGDQPKYAGLLLDPNLEILLVELGKNAVTFVNLATGIGEKYTGASSKVAFDAYQTLIAGSLRWVEKTWGKPGYFIYAHKSEPSA